MFCPKARDQPKPNGSCITLHYHTRRPSFPSTNLRPSNRLNTNPGITPTRPGTLFFSFLYGADGGGRADAANSEGVGGAEEAGSEGAEGIEEPKASVAESGIGDSVERGDEGRD